MSHPCIVAWVPFNESWGVPDLPDSPAQRHYVQALYHLTKTLDPTRPVIGNDGWESVATDIIGIHDYDDQPDRIAQRYLMDEIPRLFKRERPGGPAAAAGRADRRNSPSCSPSSAASPSPGPAGTWGYSRTETRGGVRETLPAPAERGALAARAGGLLLHAVRRHLPGGQRTAVCRPDAQVSGRADRAGYARTAHASAISSSNGSGANA